MTRRENSASAGLVPLKGKWAQVRMGSKLQGGKGTLNDVWEVVDMRNPEQFDYKMTPWYLLRNVADPTQTVAARPRPVTYAVTFLVPEDWVPEGERPKLQDENVGPHEPLSDQEAMNLLATELGATGLWWEDHETGIITCPPYEQRVGNTPEYIRHIEIAHGIDMRNVDPHDIVQIITIHGEAHAKHATLPHTAASRGFPHKHAYVPSMKPFGDFH